MNQPTVTPIFEHDLSCPNCQSELVVEIGDGPDTVYECTRCQRSFFIVDEVTKHEADAKKPPHSVH